MIFCYLCTKHTQWETFTSPAVPNAAKPLSILMIIPGSKYHNKFSNPDIIKAAKKKG